MRAKLTYFLIAALAVLGGLNIFQSLKKKYLPAPAPAYAEGHAQQADGAYVYSTHDAADADHDYDYDADDDGEAGTDDMIDRTFTVSAGDQLDVRVEHADVEIMTGTSDEAHIRVTLKGKNMRRAREVFEEMDFRVEQNGRTVLISADWPNRNWSWDKMGGAEITVLATIPARFDAHVETSHGDLVMGDLDGTIEVRTSHGDLKAGALRGAELSVTTSHGDVEVAALRAAEVNVKTSHGDIDVGDVEAERFDAKTSHADIAVARLSGRAEMSNSHGDIEVFMTKVAPATFKTSHGNIEVTMPAGARADLDLQGGTVKLDAGLRFDGELKDDRADGRIGGGGPRIHARASHGTITLRRN